MKTKIQYFKIVKKWCVMQKFIKIYTIPKETLEERKIKEYIKCYVKELQRHFDMPDKKMRSILYKVYKTMPPVSFIKKLIYMLKSFCSKN